MSSSFIVMKIISLINESPKNLDFYFGLISAVYVQWHVAPSASPLNICKINQHHLTLWQYGLWSFQAGGTKLDRFLPKNQHTQRKFLSQNLTFKVNFLCQKSSKSFSIFFSLKNDALFLAACH